LSAQNGGPPCFETALPADLLAAVQVGVMSSVYRGVPFLKSPFDIGLYLQLLAKLHPRTVIEIGSKQGGSALWFADMLSADVGDEARVVSVDIRPIAKLEDPRITFLKGEARDLGSVLTQDLLQECRRPILAIDDSSHLFDDARAVMEFFHGHLQAGDYLVVEDGVVSRFEDARYAVYEDGPNRAVAAFLELHGEQYCVDRSLCDHYGRNVTYNPSGWLRRL
jgi:cephalosporin hydroxylase